MIDLNFYNKTTLKASTIIIKYIKLPETYSLHAKVYEGLKDYKNALIFLKKALALEKDKDKLKKTEKKIAELKQKI